MEKVNKLDKMLRHSKERKRSMGGETTNGQTRDDMWMKMILQDTSKVTLSHAGACAQTSVRENTRVRVFCSQHTCRIVFSLSKNLDLVRLLEVAVPVQRVRTPSMSC